MKPCTPPITASSLPPFADRLVSVLSAALTLGLLVTGPGLAAGAQPQTTGPVREPLRASACAAADSGVNPPKPPTLSELLIPAIQGEPTLAALQANLIDLGKRADLAFDTNDSAEFLRTFRIVRRRTREETAAADPAVPGSGPSRSVEEFVLRNAAAVRAFPANTPAMPVPPAVGANPNNNGGGTGGGGTGGGAAVGGGTGGGGTASKSTTKPPPTTAEILEIGKKLASGNTLLTSLHGLHLEGGALQDFRKGGKDLLYYQADYRGHLLKKLNDQFHTASALSKLTLPNPNDVGDAPSQFRLRLDRGNAQVDGGLFNSLGLKPFAIPLIREARGIAQVSGRFDGERFNFAGGLESVPYSLLGKVGFKNSISNFLVLGALAERQSDKETATKQDKTAGLLTYRAFIGKAFGAVLSNKRRALRKTLEAEQRLLALTSGVADNDRSAMTGVVDKLEALVKEIPKDPAYQEDSPAGQALRSLYFIAKGRVDQERGRGFAGEKPSETPGEFQRRNLEAIRWFTTAKDRFHTTLWIESTGWYEMDRPLVGSRFKNLLALTLTYYLNPREDNPIFLRLRYENGRDRAAPAVRLDQVMLTVGLTL